MKYCKECGYRINTQERCCPLCGERLTAYSAPVKTHVHPEKEPCVLPNTDARRRPAARPQIHEHRERGQRRPLPNQEKKPAKKNKVFADNPKLIGVVIVILLSLLRACGG